jgi:hypothetical protein
LCLQQFETVKASTATSATLVASADLDIEAT